MIALTTVLAIGASFASAAPANKSQRPSIETRVPETSAESFQSRGNVEESGGVYHR